MRLRITPYAREWIAVVAVLIGVALLVTVVVATALDGEWGRVALVVLGAAACLAGRAIGRYDPDPEELPAPELRNRPPSG